MNLRLISGRYGKRTIQAPDGDLTHPMSERVRSSLFNIINSRLPDAEVVDAFAGTGSLGLEALSRGAKSAIFLERDRVANKILHQNIDSLGVGDMATAVKIGVSTWIDQNKDKRFDIIFADPPYNDMQLTTVARLGELLNNAGMLILSHPARTELPEFEGLVMVDNRNYGEAEVAFMKVRR